MTQHTPTTGEESSPVIAEIDMAIEGMTCASCVAHVERKLNKLPGAVAVVNLATERAHVTLTQEYSDDDLAAAVKAAGYGGTVVRREVPGVEPAQGAWDAEADTSDPSERRRADLLRRLLVSATLTVPVAVLSMIPAAQFPGWQWVVAALTLPIAAWAALPFHRAAFNAARHGSSTMDTLVSLGVIAATLWSLWALLVGGAGEIGMRMEMTVLPRHAGAHAELYFETAAVVTTFLLLGRWLESRSRHAAGDALRALAAMRPAEVTKLVREGSITRAVRVPLGQLRVGDEFRVEPGEKIATDGVVVGGRSAVDASLLTGESVPVEVGPGDAVTGATINASGSLTVRATRVGDDTALARIGKLVEDAQVRKAPIQRVVDRISSVFVPVVLAISLITFVAWLVFGGTLQAAFTAAIAVLIIACPCALGLATPTALLAGTGRAAQRGILIRGPEVLESTRRIDTVILDKTGTLTTGRMEFQRVVPLHGEDPGVVLARAAAVEALSEHPIAKAISRAAGETEPAEDFVSHAGLGVSGTVEGVRVTAGRLSHLEDAGFGVDEEARAALSHAEEGGATAVAVGWDGRVRGIVVVSDTAKDGAREAVAALRDLGIAPILLTGDAEAAARTIAQAVGIDQVHAQVMPSDKRDVVAQLQDQGHEVAMVGDGVNDAAALAQAGVHGLGIAMGTGTDVAKEASDITIVAGDPRAIPEAISISRATLRVIKQNLFWAFAYNAASIPLAAFGLLNPMIAGIAMAFSSVLVVSNSLRLRHAGGI